MLEAPYAASPSASQDDARTGGHRSPHGRKHFRHWLQLQAEAEVTIRATDIRVGRKLSWWQGASDVVCTRIYLWENLGRIDESTIVDSLAAMQNLDSLQAIGIELLKIKNPVCQSRLPIPLPCSCFS